MDPRLEMTEVDVQVEPQVAPAPDLTSPLRGFADLHVHMFAHLAHGGGVLAGEPYSTSGGAAEALSADFASDRDLVSFMDGSLRIASCPPLVPDCGTNLFHGDHTIIDDTAGLGTGDASPSHFGAPIFSGWPNWHTTTHQQVYYRWLERAWRGGMRLMVMLAVNNEVLCRSSKRIRGTDCSNSMKLIEDQLQAALEFEAWMKRRSDGSWFRIVRTPDEAEEVIRNGGLAVVLGVEPDNLFNCKLRSPCTPEYVEEQLERYYNIGVRYVFPIHDFDNAFGGTAIWQDALNIGNRLMEGEWYDAITCPTDDISNFSLGAGILPEVVAGTVGKLMQWNNVPYPVYPAGPHCNPKGLTPLGVDLVKQMMALGIIIDVDHMSARAFRDTVALAREGRYPLVAGHVTPSSINPQRHEFMRTGAQLSEIRDLGGMVGLITVGEKDQSIALEGIPVVDDCTNSSKTLAQTYLYLSKELGLSTGFGSDFNGMAPHYGPRFGDEACERGRVQGQVKAQLERQRASLANPDEPDRPLTYPFTLQGFGSFGRQVTGQRTYDFNYDGFAHIGLYPDLIADLANVGRTDQQTPGLTESELEPLFGSAAAFIRMWRRAKAASAPALAEDCARWQSAGFSSLYHERCVPTAAMQPAELDSDRWGEDYRSLSLGRLGWEACQAECSRDERCQSWTSVPAGMWGPDSLCWLKEGVPPTREATGLVSGHKHLSQSGLEVDKDRSGMDYSNFSITNSDPRLCEEACNRDLVCSAWTYVPSEDRRLSAPHCWLKNGVPSVVSAPGMISGIKPGRQ